MSDKELNAVFDGGNAEAIKLISKMAIAGSDAEVVIVETGGLGDGLPEKVPMAFDRNAQRFESLKMRLEDYRLKPKRISGKAQTHTLDSFVALIDRHKSDESVIFGVCKWPDPKLTAVIDYHSKAHQPDWLGHKIEYAFPLTDELKTWVSNNNTTMPQAEFAAFIEDHAAELASPYDGEADEFERLFKEKFATPSELLTLSRELEVFVESKAKRGERLQTGERTVEFTSEHQNSKGERVEIPGIFMLSVPAFIDGEKVRIPARLRYRLTGGDIVWFYSLYRWEYWLRDEVQNVLKDAAKKTELPFFEGVAESGGSQ